MRLILDTTPLVAIAERNHRGATAARRSLGAERSVPILSPLTAAEVDYFLQKLRGPGGNRAFVADLAANRFEVPCLELSDFQEIRRLNDRYRDLSPGIADLSVVILAARYRTTRILTFDERHFRALRPLQGGTFTLLPFDEDVT